MTLLTCPRRWSLRPRIYLILKTAPHKALMSTRSLKFEQNSKYDTNTFKIFNPSVPKDFLDMFCHLDFLWSFFDCLVFFFRGKGGVVCYVVWRYPSILLGCRWFLAAVWRVQYTSSHLCVACWLRIFPLHIFPLHILHIY